MCDCTPHLPEPADVLPSGSTAGRRLNRRHALMALAAGAGVLAVGAFGGGSVTAADGPLDEPGNALRPARRMILEPRSVPTPPAGKLIFPIEIPPTSNIYVLDNFGDCRNHEGIDILAAKGGNPVFAVADGQLTKRYTNTGTAGWGWTLYVAETRMTYKYFHLAEDPNALSEGMRVRMGDVLGFVGSSGTNSATNFHLHFEVRPNNVPVNPLPLLDIPADILIGPPQPSC
jgi:murein DD-endopeptidase MepM/ murein hydrolase activator NlpD